MSDFTILGKIVNTHGIKGVVKIYPYTEHLNQFCPGKILYIGKNHRPYSIETVRTQKNMVYVKFKGIDSMTEGENLKDAMVAIEKEDRRQLKEDEYFIEDIIGYQVIDENAEKIGQLKEVVKGLANDVFVVSNGEKTWQIPAVKAFILEVNKEKTLLKVHLIEGMEE